MKAITGIRGRTTLAAIVTASIALITSPADAAPPESASSVVQCGQVITRSTTLVADVGPCPGDGIVIGADNIRLNLNGHSVFGTPGPGDGSSAGIRLPNRNGVVLHGFPAARGRRGPGTIADFDAGVVINRGSGNTVMNLVVRDNIGPASTAAELGDGIVLFHSAGNRLLNNVVSHNGHYDGIGVYGLGSDSNVLRGNTVEDTVGVRNDISLSGTGVVINHFLDQPIGTGQVIFNNNAEGNIVRRNFGSGISNISNVNGQILDNVVVDNGLSYYSDIEAFSNRAVANGIGIQRGPDAPGATNMLVRGNTINHNGLIGILVTSEGNRLENNEVFRNGIVGIVLEDPAMNNSVTFNRTGFNAFLDLADIHPDCDNNVWFGNTWGPVQPLALELGLTTSYTPECTATGGHEEPSPTVATAEAPREPGSAANRSSDLLSPGSDRQAERSRRPPR